MTGLLRKVFAVLLVVLVSTPALALTKRLRNQLMRLDPTARLEQVCDAGAMERITKGPNPYRVDRVVAYAFEEPSVGPNSVTAAGAAFRSKGEWYRFSFQCTTDADNLEVVALTYDIGERIPREQWEQHNLYD